MTRTLGPVPDVAGLGKGDHVCWIYAGDAEHRAGLTRYLAAGLARGERIAYLYDRVGEATILSYLASGGLGPEKLCGDGTLILAPARESYPRTDAGYDLPAAKAQFRAMADQAVADGFTGLRVAGESGFLLTDEMPQSEYMTYELGCDFVVRDAPLTAMCLYDIRHDPAHRLGEIAAVHAASIVATSATGHLPTYRLWAMDDALGVGGEIDFACSDTVREVLAASIGAGYRVIDVSNVKFADVAGIRALTHIASRIAGAGGGPVVRGASPQMRFVAAQFQAEHLLFSA